jgi:plastocyanin
MLRMMIPVALFLAPLPLLAQPVEPVRVEIDLSSFKFEPATITLDHGRPYILHFVNRSGSGHDFVAKAFFAAATVASEDRARTANGGVELEGNQSVDIHLTIPRPGTYDVHCSHFMHSTFGMKATIIVR